MASQRTKFTVGLFLTTGIGMFILAIMWLGMSHFFEKGMYYATYFNESVQGLEIDSAVKYRGVPVGRVEDIGVAPDSKLIQVVLKIESGQRLDSDIVAQLKSVGTMGITGIMFVELDRKREGEADQSPPLGFPSEYPIVASKPAEMSELRRDIDDALDQIKALDLEEISGKINVMLDNISGKVSDVDVKGISRGLESSLGRINRVMDDQRWDNILASVEEAAHALKALMDKADRSLSRLDSAIGGVEGIVLEEEKNIKTAIKDLRQAMENANSLFEEGSSLVSGTDDSLSHLTRHLLVVAQNLETASENLNRLMELLASQPSQLLFGEPPTPRKVEED